MDSGQPVATAEPAQYRALSLWFDTVPGSLRPRPALGADLDVDVAIVGAGFTGLWTAYYLATLDPRLRVAVLERDIAGFGASGRNGGWCSAFFPASWERVARGSSRATALALHRALAGSVDEVGDVAAREGLDIHYLKGGSLEVARTAVQADRIRARVAAGHELGFGPDDLRWLGRDEAAARIVVAGCRGASYTPHCARLHPARLARGLGEVVERRGVRIFERSPVIDLAPRSLRTPHGRIRAEVVVRATEGYTAALPAQHRALVPLYSLMIATEPLPAGFWEEVGWQGRETLTDGRRLLIYAQRTADDRIAFGGRGAPYHYGSRVAPRYDREPAVFDALRSALAGLFPAAAGALVTHRWGGPLGVPRDWFPSVGLDRRAGVAWAGGYVGDGVGTTNLAGRTLADLVLGRDSELARLPWVGHRSRDWEPEPLRWLGINAGLRLMAGADRAEATRGRPARRARLVERLLGG